VNAPTGIFSGLVKHSELSGKTVNVFLGIPFAESVSGSKRWTNPVAKAYLGRFDAKAFGPVCPQDTTWGARISDMPQSEDCLTLNVWTPSGTPPEGGFPVMFYIYGGAYLHGGTSDPLFDAVSLVASQDVIVVTANYRIGALGFLAGKIGNATFTGNYGILDQQLAMKWVQKNISAFGGNPANVTLFGESAGAISVSLHLLSIPSSEPLFQAAIIESDPVGAPMALPDRAQQIAEAFAKNLGCDNIDDPLKCLLAIVPGSLATTPSIIAAQQSKDVISTGVKQGLGVFLMWAPYLDGQLIVRQILDGTMSGNLKKPTIWGMNRNEVPVFTTAIPENIFSKTCYSQLIPFYLGDDKGANVLNHSPYTPSNDAATNKAAFANILESRVFHCASQVAVRQDGAPAPYPNKYDYQFTHHSDWESNTLFKTTPECGEPGAACHEAELPYVFNTPGVFVDGSNPPSAFTSEEAKLSAAMQTYWGNFAKNKNPNIGNPVPIPWPKFATGAKNTTYLILDTPPSTQDALPDDFQCAFWDSIGWAPPVLGKLPETCSVPPVGIKPRGGS
jgi:carboxylesterase type B